MRLSKLPPFEEWTGPGLHRTGYGTSDVTAWPLGALNGTIPLKDRCWLETPEELRKFWDALDSIHDSRNSQR